MIPHIQTILGDPARGDGHNAEGVPGNCWQTVIASLMDLPLVAVPHFVAEYGDRWHTATQDFVEFQTEGTKELLWWNYGKDRHVPGDTGYAIGSGPSPRGEFWHAVIIDLATLTVAHDPHPSGAGILSLEEIAAIVPKRG